jgi:predicted SnoaL-like aldol condensation-catalyzing enzyme
VQETQSGGASGQESLAQRNARIALAYHSAVFARYELDAIDEHVAEDIVQHKESVPDGRAHLREFCERLAERQPRRRNRIVRVIADDDFAVLHGHITDTDTGEEAVAVDIVRMMDGKIVEHWEVVEAVPDGSDARTRL